MELQVSWGLNVIRLATESIRVPRYVPLPPSLADPATVTETVELFFDDLEEGRQVVALLTRMFNQARRRRKLQRGRRAYVQFRAHTSEPLYRSELLGGRAEWEEQILRPWRVGRNRGKATITFLRMAFWEGELVEIPLSNRGGLSVVGGLTVWNHDDLTGVTAAHSWHGVRAVPTRPATVIDTLGHDNTAYIMGQSIEGQLPSPVVLAMTNTAASHPVRTNTIYVGHTIIGDPEGFPHGLEAESGTGGTTTTAATSSAGEHQTLAWSGTAQHQLLEWTLSSELLADLQGGFVRVLARFASAIGYTDCRVQWRLALGTNVVYTSQEMLLSSALTLQDLGLLQLPPRSVGMFGAALSLQLWARRETVGSHTLALDFLHLFPTEGWRQYQNVGYGMEAGRRILDDGNAELLYVDNGADLDRTSDYVAYGKPLEVWPGEHQRLLFLHDALDGGSEIDRTLLVQAWYRPRWVTPL